MAERASVFQSVQIGVESTPGTSVAANKKLNSLSISPAVKIDVSTFRAMGNKFNSVAALGKNYVTAKLSGAPTYDELIYPLSGLLSYALPAQQGATAAYKWTFSPATSAADTVKTFTVEQGSSVRAHKFTFGQVTGLGMKFARSGIDLSGDMIGAALTDSITMTNSPTALPLIPLLPTQVDVKYADTQAGLTGATALARVLSADWSISDRFNPVWPLQTSSGSAGGFATVVEAAPKSQLKIKMEADAEGMALLTTANSSATKFFRIQAVGALIASTYYYTMQLDFAGKVTDVSDFSDEDGVFAVEWTLDAVHDSTWGKALEIQLTNTQTTL